MFKNLVDMNLCQHFLNIYKLISSQLFTFIDVIYYFNPISLLYAKHFGANEVVY
jgi:hypothetical protein